jgi:hypothetical protein
MNIAGLDCGDFSTRKARQDDSVEHRPVVLDTPGALLRDCVLLKVIGHKLPNGRSFANGPIIRNRIVTFQSVSKENAGALFGFVER